MNYLGVVVTLLGMVGAFLLGVNEGEEQVRQHVVHNCPAVGWTR